MFTLKLNKLFERFDPYGYSRLMGFKAVYTAIILYIANMLIQPPLAPLIMLLSAAGALIIEMPTINNLKKKDLIYLGYLILISITVGVFSSYIPFNIVFIIAVSTWGYLLYIALQKQPSLFPIVSILLMLGIMSLEAINTANFFIILTEIKYIWAFGIIVFFAHKFFPNYYHRMWRNAVLRNLEETSYSLNNINNANSKKIYKHYLAMINTLPIIRVGHLYNIVKTTRLINQYNFFIYGEIDKSSVDLPTIKILQESIKQIYDAIYNGDYLEYKSIELDNKTLQTNNRLINKISLNWNKICIAVSS
ncbi:MAG: hypothetical protein PHC75_06900 [Burkholderiales bacterium]|nr:hypothetical protein [Burkholderiales bacterium]